MKTIKFISTTLNEYLNENNTYSNDIELLTSGEYDLDMEDLNHKLNIINKYFPFKYVKGKIDTEEYIDISFDNAMSIIGNTDKEPYIVKFNIGNNVYDLDIHPHNSMGGFDNKIFEHNIELIHNNENCISIVISKGGYADKSITINKNELEEYKIHLVSGNQSEGKVLGKTDALNESDYTEINMEKYKNK